MPIREISDDFARIFEVEWIGGVSFFGDRRKIKLAARHEYEIINHIEQKYSDGDSKFKIVSIIEKECMATPTYIRNVFDGMEYKHIKVLGYEGKMPTKVFCFEDQYIGIVFVKGSGNDAWLKLIFSNGIFMISPRELVIKKYSPNKHQELYEDIANSFNKYYYSLENAPAVLR